MTNRKTTLKPQLPPASAGWTQTGSDEGELLRGRQVDVTMAAARVAHGQATNEATRGMVSARASSPATRVYLAHAIDSVAIEVKSLLGRMRLIATQSANRDESSRYHTLLQEEFEVIQDEMDSVVAEVAASMASAADAEGSFQGLTAGELKVDRNHARVDSCIEAEWALFRIDSAERSVEAIRDEFGTIDERIDAALSALERFVATIVPDRKCCTSADEALGSAERIRLQGMQKRGLTTPGPSDQFQRSVTALLQ